MAGNGERRIPSVRHPVAFSQTPVSYELAPPELNASSDLVRTWLAAKEVRLVG